ncbi:MAG: ATP-binding cassette domain-containing protein, partial [Janthinobacterium lividum]
MASTPSPVKLDQVTFRYSSDSPSHGVPANLDALSLEINGGEFLSLLGPSGCGKTTTLKLLAGLLTPDHGEVFIGSRRVTKVPSHQRNIGMVFQNYALFPHLTAAQNVAFPLRMKRKLDPGA